MIYSCFPLRRRLQLGDDVLGRLEHGTLMPPVIITTHLLGSVALIAMT